MKKILLTLLLLSAGSAFAQKVSSITGNVAGGNLADPSDNQISLTATITIQGIPQTAVANGLAAQQTDLVNNLALSFPDFTLSSYPILYTTSQSNITAASTNPYFYWALSGAGAVISQQAPSLTYQIVFNVIIYANPNMSPPASFSGPSTPAGATPYFPTAAGGSINLIAAFVAQTSPGVYDSNISTATQGSQLEEPIQQIFSSPTTAPLGFNVKNGYKSITVTWNSTTSVAYLPLPAATDTNANPTQINQIPTEVLIMVFNPGATNVQLNANDASNTPDYTPNTCVFNSGAASGSSCITCDPDPTGTFPWITNTQPNNADIQSFNVEANDGSFLIDNLVVGETYTVVMQYAQGTQQTVCKLATPYINYSVSELNGGDQPNQGDPRCFIVSAAFGSPLNRHVNIFRWARDRFLEPFAWGHKFVEFYYDHSQPFANLVKSSPVLQVIVRTFLYPLAFFLYALQESTEYPVLSFLFAATLLSFFLWLRRRKFSRVA